MHYNTTLPQAITDAFNMVISYRKNKILGFILKLFLYVRKFVKDVKNSSENQTNRWF